MHFFFLVFTITSFVLAAPSGTFDVLSLNVAGLPAFLNANGQANKTSSALQMGQILGRQNYSVIHLQEVITAKFYENNFFFQDFNYHEILYQFDTHPFRTETSGPAGFGSGLNTL